MLLPGFSSTYYDNGIRAALIPKLKTILAAKGGTPTVIVTGDGLHHAQNARSKGCMPAGLLIAENPGTDLLLRARWPNFSSVESARPTDHSALSCCAPCDAASAPPVSCLLFPVQGPHVAVLAAVDLATDKAAEVGITNPW